MSLFQGEFPPLRGFQLLAHESLRDGARAGHKKQLVMAPTGSGKCLGPLTPVIMSDGSIKRACRVKAGDRLMGPDGKGRNVVGVNRGTGPLYRVIPTKGDAFTCNDVHLLSLVRTPGSDGINLPSGRHIGREESGPFFVEAQDLARANDTAKHCLKAWRPEAVDFESECTVHPIPPYILGLWLGDGTSRSSIITKPDGPVVQAWRDYAASIGCEVTQIKANGKCDGWRIKKSTHGHEHNHLHAALIGLGILGNKRIPQSYIMTTRQDRLELLAGLLDTDGSLLCGGYDFIQKEKQIADAVVFLCRSLGLAAYVSNQLKGIASTGFEAFYWRVSISGDCSIIPCRDPKKRAPARMQKKNHLVTGLRIKSVGIGPYVGFEIDGDRQFLLGDWQVTHNTILALNYIQQALKKGKRAMFVCDRKTLIAQTSNVAREVGLGYHGIIQANNPMMDLSRPFQIASAQTLMRRGWPQNMDVIVVDECFPGYTLVSTPDGPKRIDTLCNGDAVINTCGESNIVSCFKKVAFSTVKMRLSNGQEIECTPSHPFFTEMGWRPAGTLARGTRLFRVQDMPGLWAGDPAIHDQDGDTRGILGDGTRVQSSGVLRKILRQEIEEPNEQRRNTSETVGNLQAAWDQSCQKMGKWERNDPDSGINVGVARGIMGSGSRREDVQVVETGLPTSLQGGYSQRNIEGCGGAGREFPSITEAPGARPEEGCTPESPWVESLEVVEYPSGIDVFNLRVAGHPSYFAGGVLVHNCHAQYKTWVDYVTSDECNAHVLGLSATPFSTGLGRIFTNLINAATMHDLVNLGILVPMRIFSCRKPDMEGAETSGGEWTERAAEERELVIVGDVIREWTRFAENRKTIVFGATILHCEEMARQFNEAGIPAATFCADTPDDERARIIREFSFGNIRILISVEALAKGFDVKDIGCVCDCRPLRKSLSTAIQMWGRGLRSSPETGKEDCFLLDFSGNIIRFADDFSRIYFNGLDKLDDGEKLDKEIRKDEEKPIKACPKCGYKPMGKRCVGCGYEPEPKALIEQLPGEMTEIKLKNGKILAADKVELFCQLSTYVKSSSIADPEKREKRVMALYKAIANEWPPREMKAATAPEVQPKRATISKIKSIYTAWAHRKAS